MADFSSIKENIRRFDEGKIVPSLNDASVLLPDEIKLFPEKPLLTLDIVESLVVCDLHIPGFQSKES